jgi:malonate transporter and related proteins
MSAALTVVLPVFALIMMGAGCRRFDLLGSEAVRELNRFSVYVAQPALLFGITAHAEWSAFQPGFALAVGGALFLPFLVVAVVMWRRAGGENAVIDALCATSANCGLIGLPLVTLIEGRSGLAFAASAALITGCVLQAVGVAGMELGRASGHGPWRAVGKAASVVLRHPMVVAPAAGVAVSLIGLPLPEGAETFVRLLGGAAIPLGLVTLGLFIADHARFDRKDLGWAPLVAIKLAGTPVLAWMLAGPVLGLSDQAVRLAVLSAMMPTGAGPFMLAQVYGCRGAVAAQATLYSTVLAVVTISLFLTLWP